VDTRVYRLPISAHSCQPLLKKSGLPLERIVIGSNHLGPYPWRTERAETAKGKSCTLAHQCVQAGYTKLHLDTSIPLDGDGFEEGQPLGLHLPHLMHGELSPNPKATVKDLIRDFMPTYIVAITDNAKEGDARHD
jgi:tagatose-1,6-bisphosphate aldolase non-catalytic subunit AgaZ/GatZ